MQYTKHQPAEFKNKVHTEFNFVKGHLRPISVLEVREHLQDYSEVV